MWKQSKYFLKWGQIRVRIYKKATYFGIAIVSNSPTPQIEYSEINDNLLPAFKISKISSMTIGNSMTIGKKILSTEEMELKWYSIFDYESPFPIMKLTNSDAPKPLLFRVSP